VSLVFLSSSIISPLMEKSLPVSVFDKGAHRYPVSQSRATAAVQDWRVEPKGSPV
jgi:hypothetical protein